MSFMAINPPVEPGSFQVSLTHLPRRPGNMWESALEFIAPSELEVGMARLAPGSKMPADIRIESVLDGVLVLTLNLRSKPNVRGALSHSCGQMKPT